MNPFSNWFSRYSAGFWGYFQKIAFSASKDVTRGYLGRTEFDSWLSRNARYTLNWALYENTAYDNIHLYARQHKVDYALYPEIRNILNPATREGDFWQTHLYGGALDELAGDGVKTKTAIPILDATDVERAAISQLWIDSRWAQGKDVYAGLGAKLGDVALKIEDYPQSRQYGNEQPGRVCIRVIDPRTLTDYREDDEGNCVGYQIERWVRDEDAPASQGSATGENPPRALYREIAVKDGSGVRYATYKGDEAYAWNGRAATWTMDYPRVPLFLTAHNKILPDTPFGVSGIWPVLSKIRELDDIASRLSDFVAKSINAPWLLAGVNPNTKPSFARTTRTVGDPEPTKTEIPTLFGGPEARAQPLIAPLDFPGVLAYMDAIQEEIKDDLPEIRKDNEMAAGDASGAALKVGRQRTEAKAQSIRAGYDHTLVRAMKLALDMGSNGGYEGYAGAGGDHKFRIGHRSVFETDPMDELEYSAKFWEIAESADRAGCPLPAYLESIGKDEGFIKKITDAQDAYMKKGLEVGRSKAQSPVNGDAAAKAVQSPNGVVK